MSWRVATYSLAGVELVNALPVGDFTFIHSLRGPGSFSTDVSMVNVDRADVEPGQVDYRIFEDATPRAAGRIWTARVDTNYDVRKATIEGEGYKSLLRRRFVPYAARYEKVTEDPVNPLTEYELSQEEIAWSMLDKAQGETGGDIGITLGTHTGGSHLRRRWYCAEEGLTIAEVIDEFGELSDGFDWAITPTLSNPAVKEFDTWNPSRGTNLTGSVTLDGAQYLDTFSYEIDAGSIVTRAFTRGEGECDPPLGNEVDTAARDDYGLLEDFDSVDSTEQEDLDEHATAMLSLALIPGQDVWYELSKGPALGTFDVGDRINLVSERTGWELDIDVVVQEIEVSVQMPENVFVRVNFSQVESGS